MCVVRSDATRTYDGMSGAHRQPTLEERLILGGGAWVLREAAVVHQDAEGAVCAVLLGLDEHGFQDGQQLAHLLPFAVRVEGVEPRAATERRARVSTSACSPRGDTHARVNLLARA